MIPWYQPCHIPSKCFARANTKYIFMLWCYHAIMLESNVILNDLAGGAAVNKSNSSHHNIVVQANITTYNSHIRSALKMSWDFILYFILYYLLVSYRPTSLVAMLATKLLGGRKIITRIVTHVVRNNVTTVRCVRINVITAALYYMRY